MAREFAPIQTRIWTNPDFTNLSTHAQLLYLTCLSHPTITHAGVIDYRPNRLAALSPTWTPENIEHAATELEQHHFLIIDRDTEEALIRSFHRNDGLMRQQNMATSAARAIQKVASRHIHTWIAHELHRLKQDSPYLAGWKSAEILQYMDDNPSDEHPPKDTYPQGVNNPIDPSNHPPIDPSNDPSNDPQRKGASEGSDGGSDDPSPRTRNIEHTPQGVHVDSKYKSAGAHDPTPPNFLSEGAISGGADAPALAARWVGDPEVVSDAEDARCRSHAGLGRVEVPSCGGCGAARRLAGERLKNAQKRASDGLRGVSEGCTLCDEFSWLLDASGAVLVPAVRCDHGERALGHLADLANSEVCNVSNVGHLRAV